MSHPPFAKARGAAAFLLPALFLAACGGGGSSSDSSSNASPPPPVTPAALVISGTAATGAAMANASITVSCATGSFTTTADTNGGFTGTISGGALPCVLTATSSDGSTELHSVAAGTGSAATTSNITPLSELLIARLAGTDPKAFVASFGASTPISATAVTAAQAALLQDLSAAGLNTSSVSDILAGTLTAGSGTGYDGVLDALKTSLANAGVTLADLSSAVSTSGQLGTATATATLGTVLAPAAADCAGLKTGTLRVMDFGSGTNGLVQVDATAMTAVIDGTRYSLSRNASCDYTANDPASTRVLVARSGLAVLLQGSGVNGVVGLAIPEQRLDVAALAGHYDRVQYGATFDNEGGDFGDTEFAADGQNGLSMNCPQGYGNCVLDQQPKGKLVANANGGFDYMDNGVSSARVFAFRNASGRNLLVGQAPDGTVIVLAAKDTLALPAVGRVASYWQFTVNSSGLNPVTADSNTVIAADATTHAVSRRFDSDSHTDTITFNTPFDGTRYRAANACATSTGAQQTCNGVVQLPFGGVVLSVSSVPAKHFITVSVDKP